MRVARAAGLLRDRDATLDVIAARTGFDSGGTLSRAFKCRFGVPPGGYRRNNARLGGNGGALRK